VGSDWVWDLRWRRPLFVWENDLLTELLRVVSRQSRSDREDWWSCTLSQDGRYSVKSAYSHLVQGLPGVGVRSELTLEAVSQVWKSCVPSKVVVFSWQLILDRIPTRRNLLGRGVHLPVGGLGCVFCEASSESSLHLFISCSFILPVWYQVPRWLGWDFVSPLGLTQHFLSFTGLGKGKRVRLGLLLGYHVVI